MGMGKGHRIDNYMSSVGFVGIEMEYIPACIFLFGLRIVVLAVCGH